MRKTGRFIGRRWLALLVLAGLIALRVWDPAQVKFIRENAWFDQFQKFDAYVPPERHTVIVDIDEESLAEDAMGQWPWSRYDLAKMVQILSQLGARVVGFDVVFAEKDKLSPQQYALRMETLPPEIARTLTAMPSNDQVFASVLAQSPVVLGGAALYRQVDRDEPLPKSARIAEINGSGKSWLPLYPDMTRNTPVLQAATPGFGIFSVDPSSDGVVRRVPAMVRIGPANDLKAQQVYPTLSLEMLRLAHGEKGFVIEKADENSGISKIRMRSKVKEGGLHIPTDEHGILWVRFSKSEPGIYISAKDILKIDPANQAKVQELYNRINGKYVLVGTSAEGLKDIRATPLEGAMPGVEVHAQLLDMVENEDFIIRPSIASAIEIFVILVAGLALIAFVPNLSAFTTVAFFVPFCMMLLGGSWYLYVHESILIGGLTPVVALFILFVLLVYQKYAREQEQKKQVRGAFAQYLSPALVEQLAEDPSRLTLGGETKTMTFLFCDIRGFTPISESFKGEPQGLTRLINKFLTPMTDIIMGNHGTIDKYMGDCIMAFWNAPLNDSEHPRHACESALLMQTELVALNDRLKVEAEQEGRKFIPINIGIGVNTGDCVVGNMGSEQRFDYSVLGDAVNLASRLEGQSKGYGVINVIGESTAQTVQDFGIIELDLIAVKGKDEAVRIFTILGGPEYALTDTYKALRPEADGLIVAYRERRFADAQAHLDRCRELVPERSGLWDLYQERLDEYAINPPAADWDGVYRATSK